MFCEQCGSQINEDANYCSNCGYPLKHAGDFKGLKIEQENFNEVKEWMDRVRPIAAMICCVDNVDAVYKALQEQDNTGKGFIKVLDNASGQQPYIRCFGNFEIFYHGTPIHFNSQKTKEMVAYLVDRCWARCTNAEIIATLWEDDKDHTSYLKKIKKDLRDTLKRIGIPDMVIFARGNVYLNVQSVSCDYYDWKNGILTDEKLVNGEYMEQYSWAETTKGEILSAYSTDFSEI